MSMMTITPNSSSSGYSESPANVPVPVSLSIEPEQRLQLHQQLMGRPASPAPTLQHLAGLEPRSARNSIRQTLMVVDPFTAAHSDSSPYSHAFLYRSGSPHSPSSSTGSLLNSATPTQCPPPALHLHRPSTSSSHPLPFDPDLQAELVRLRKLESRRSLSQSQTIQPERMSASVKSRDSFRSVGPSIGGKRTRLPLPLTGQVHRPSPLRSASTPSLVRDETEAEKKLRRKEMKAEYEKMRRGMIEEEKARQAVQRAVSEQSWLAGRFKRVRRLPVTTPAPGHAPGECRSISRSSGTSTAASVLLIDDGARSPATVPTSVEEEDDHRPRRNEDLLDACSETGSPVDSPPADPFRKSMLPGQVPPTPTRPPILPRHTQGSLGKHKLTKLFDSFKISSNRTDTDSSSGGSKRRAQVSVVDVKTPFAAPVDGAPTGWLGSIRSMRTRSKTNESNHHAPMGTKNKKKVAPEVPSLPERFVVKV